MEGSQASLVCPSGKRNILMKDGYWKGKTEEFEKNYSCAFFSPQISHGGNGNQTRAFTVRGQRLNAEVTARFKDEKSGSTFLSSASPISEGAQVLRSSHG